MRMRDISSQLSQEYRGVTHLASVTIFVRINSWVELPTHTRTLTKKSCLNDIFCRDGISLTETS